MNWEELFCRDRLCRLDSDEDDGRSPFQRDIDRIVFSFAFRRLANKTQVHPLAENDHIHNRLTHSIETASVGRSLGTIIGNKLGKEIENFGLHKDELGYVVQAACLAHDIGNPPFGHVGEETIRNWFKNKIESEQFFRTELTKEQKTDLTKFEGNAQGFRIITQIENRKNDGGLQLTYPVLGAFTKYPRPSFCLEADLDPYIGNQKFSFFLKEQKYFTQVASKLGLRQRGSGEKFWSRHPMAFLVEAADDTCYHIVDIEDAHALRDISFNDAEKLLRDLAGNKNYPSNLNNQEKISFLRAIAIGNTVNELSNVFIDNKKELLDGTFTTDLISVSKVNESYNNLKETAKEIVFTTHRKTMIEIASRNIIHGLLDVFFEIAEDLLINRSNTEKLSSRNQKLIRFMKSDFSDVDDLYTCSLKITDYISGMTDKFALETYRNLNGISF